MYVWVSYRCRHNRLMDAGSCGEHQRTHRLHWVFNEDPRVTLLYLVLPAAVHAYDAVAYWTLSLRNHRRLVHDAKILLFYQRSRWNPGLVNILDDRRLLLDRSEEVLLLLLLHFHIRDLMSHLKSSAVISNQTRLKINEVNLHLFMSVDVVRVPATFTFTVDASFRVDVARTSLAAAGQLPWCCRCIPTPATPSLLRVIEVRCQACCRLRRYHIRRGVWSRLLVLCLLRIRELHWRPLEVRVHHVFSLYYGHLKREKCQRLSWSLRSWRELTLLLLLTGETASSGGLRFNVILLPLPV